MSKFKDHYLPKSEVEEFNHLFNMFQDLYGMRYSCEPFRVVEDDGSLGWGEGNEICEVEDYENFYASTSYMYKFYKLIKKEFGNE